MTTPWGVSKQLEKALQREVVYNTLYGWYGVVMDDGMIEITSSYHLMDRVERDHNWITFFEAPGGNQPRDDVSELNEAGDSPI